MAEVKKVKKKKKKLLLFTIIGAVIILIIIAVVVSGGKEKLVTVQTEKVMKRNICRQKEFKIIGGSAEKIKFRCRNHW